MQTSTAVSDIQNSFKFFKIKFLGEIINQSASLGESTSEFKLYDEIKLHHWSFFRSFVQNMYTYKSKRPYLLVKLFII